MVTSSLLLPSPRFFCLLLLKLNKRVFRMGVVTLSLIFHSPVFFRPIFKGFMSSETLHTPGLLHCHGPWPPLCSTQRRNQNSRGSLAPWHCATQGRTKDPTVPTPLISSSAIPSSSHPNVPSIAHQFPAPPCSQFSQFLMEKTQRKS